MKTVRLSGGPYGGLVKNLYEGDRIEINGHLYLPHPNDANYLFYKEPSEQPNMTQTTPSWITARCRAIEMHKSVNHMYDGKPYEHHLYMVDDAVYQFQHLIPEDKLEIVRSAAWLHDTIEDCRVTYNDIKNEFGEEVSDIVYALTNEKGRTRKERANAKYYEGIRETKYAAFVKLCDRIANVKHSKKSGSSMFSKYEQENGDFMARLDPGCYWLPMWQYLDSLFSSTI